jgi:hypothetical protein
LKVGQSPEFEVRANLSAPPTWSATSRGNVANPPGPWIASLQGPPFFSGASLRPDQVPRFLLRTHNRGRLP